MKSAQRKDFFREIKKSLNRYLSILFIVALGVAFYAGIRSAEPDMQQSADRYYDQQRMMDIRVLGTLGVTGQDVDAIKGIGGIEEAEGAYAGDYFCVSGESTYILNVFSLCEKMNQMTVLEGRLPERLDECFMDKELMEAMGLGLGDTIHLSSGTDDGLEDSLVQADYTIVGYGNHAFYLAIDRGTTTIGDGKIDGFIGVLPEAFCLDYYTVIYALVSDALEENSYSDSYQEKMDSMVQEIEAIAEGQCEIHFAEIKGEAQEKIDEGRQELEDAKAEADEKLQDAAQEIADGETDLADGRKKLADAEAELADGKKKIADGKQELADAKVELAEKEQEIADAKKKLSDAAQELADGRQKLEDGRAELDKAVAQWEDGRKEADRGWEEYHDGVAKLNQAEEELKEQEGELNTQEASLKEALAQLDVQEAYLAELKGAEASLNAQLGKVDEELEKINAEIENLDQGTGQEEESESGIAGTEEQEEPENPETGRQELEMKREELEEARQELLRQLEGIAQIREPLEQGLAQAPELRRKLDAGLGEIAAYRVQIEGGRKTLEAEKEKLPEARKKLEEAEDELEEGWKAIEEASQELAEGEEELEKGEAELADGEREIADGEQKIADAYIEIADNEKKLADGEAELPEAEQKIADAHKDIEEGEKRLADGRKEYEEGKKEAEEEIAEAEEKLADAQRELDDLEAPEWYVLDRGSIQNYVEYGMDADRMKALGQVFPSIFYLVAALVALTTMTRMVEEERTLMGTMKAMGYGKFSIALKYMLYALSASLLGSVLGIFVGSKILPWVIMTAYRMLYKNLTIILLPIHTGLALEATGIAVACTALAAGAACYKELMATPAKLMRPAAPVQGKRVLLEYLPFVWKRMSFTGKSTIRNLFRYKKRFLMTVFGIGGCMGLLMVGYGLRDSIQEIVNRQYAAIWTYDASLTVDGDAAAEERTAFQAELMEEWEEIHETMYVHHVAADVEKDEVTESANIFVPGDMEKLGQFVVLQDRISGQLYSLEDGGAIISEKLASLLGVEAGDEIILKEGETKGHSVTVQAISENYLYHYVYMTENTYEALYGEKPEWNQLFLKMDRLAEDEELEMNSILLADDMVEGVQFVRALQEKVENMLHSLDLVIWVLIGAAGLLAFVVLYNLNNINITERRRELATLKVLGFYDGETAAYVYRENVYLTVIGILFGVVLGTVLHRFVVLTCEIDMMMFGRKIHGLSYVYSVLLTILFSLVVNGTMYFKLKKIDMVESLKSVE